MCVARRSFRDRHTVDWGLTRKLLEHLGGTSKSVTGLADGDVENELLDAQLPHGVGGLVLGGLGGRLCTNVSISKELF